MKLAELFEAQEDLAGASLVLATLTVDYQDEDADEDHKVVKVYWSAKDMDDAKGQAESINELVDPEYDLAEAPWIKGVMKKAVGGIVNVMRIEFSSAKAVTKVPSSAFEIPKQDF
jgi:hypothetical protein